MKIKAIFATAVSAFVIQSAFAGTGWDLPTDSGKGYAIEAIEAFAVESSPDLGGQVSTGYDTDYIWKGVRFARDVVWGDVNYTFENLPLAPNIGVWHLSSLGSGVANGGSDDYGDETNFYAKASVPSIFGFENSVGYVWNLFPTTRGRSGTPNNGGDSFQRVQFSSSRELISGLYFNYLAEWFFGGNFSSSNDSELNAWFHTFGLATTIPLGDRFGLDLSADFLYNDGLFSGLNRLGTNAGRVGGSGSGFNSYLVKAALPIELKNNATLTPYISYNGTPDGWVSDGNDQILGGGNANDVLSGGVSLSIKF